MQVRNNPVGRLGALVIWATLVSASPGAAWSQTANDPRVAEIIEVLRNGTDEQFEDLRDPCRKVGREREDGRRDPRIFGGVCPGPDREPDHDQANGEIALQSDKSDLPELEHSGTFAAVTFVPGVRGDPTTFTALEDLLRQSMRSGRVVDAARHARELARLVDEADQDQVHVHTLTEIGIALVSTGQADQAETYLRRALGRQIAERLPVAGTIGTSLSSDLLSMDMAMAVSGLARVAAMQERPDEARRLHDRALALSADPDNVEVLKAYALFEKQRGRYLEASKLLVRSTELSLQFYRESTAAADSQNQLGHLALAQGKLEEAYKYFREAAATNTQIALGGAGDPMFHQREGDFLLQQRRIFEDVVGTALALADIKPSERARLASESFEAAQWAERTTTAAALSRMTARLASHDDELASLAREFDGVLAQRQKLEKDLLVHLAARHMQDAAGLRSRIGELEAEAHSIQKRLGDRFPKYAALAYPKPIAAADVQALLGPSEALVQFLFTPDNGYAWVFTPADRRVVKLSVGEKGLAERVSLLRCGLDSGEWFWDRSKWRAAYERCRSLENRRNAAKPLPFSPELAHQLYSELFGGLRDIIADKALLVVPTGALSALPLQVLIAEPPGGASYSALHWLALRHSVSILPSAATLGGLRNPGSTVGTAPRTYLGVGNPLLSGDATKAEDVRRAALARLQQGCPTSSMSAVKTSMTSMLGMRGLLRGEIADAEALRSAVPLPETAVELCAVAQALGAPASDVLLGVRATEGSIRALSAAGTLKNYSILHFATHGLLASDTAAVGAIAPEPALLMTPPQIPSDEDDGLLTASEIARLELAADWVILSACNTAAGESDGAEALSGLGRAFFYAGARALMVSHWPVYSDATVKLVTGTLSRIAADGSVGRAEALRQSMLALISTGTASQTHPAYWAPFVVVGDGGTSLMRAPSASFSVDEQKFPPNRAAAKYLSKGKEPAPDWRHDVWRP